MVIQSPMRISVEEFEKIASLPENKDRRLEYVGGAIIDAASNSLASQIALRIGSRISLYVETNNLGFVSGADGGYRVSGEAYIPDVGFISRAKHPQRPRETWVPYAPDLAVEVASPSDRQSDIADKVTNYLVAGTVVWYVYPEEQVIKIYEPGTAVKTLMITDTLHGGTVLPGFRVDLQAIFPTEE